MKFSHAESYAKLLFVLFRLKLITARGYHNVINKITTMTLAHQMKEERDGKSSKTD